MVQSLMSSSSAWSRRRQRTCRGRGRAAGRRGRSAERACRFTSVQSGSTTRSDVAGRARRTPATTTGSPARSPVPDERRGRSRRRRRWPHVDAGRPGTASRRGLAARARTRRSATPSCRRRSAACGGRSLGADRPTAGGARRARRAGASSATSVARTIAERARGRRVEPWPAPASASPAAPSAARVGRGDSRRVSTPAAVVVTRESVDDRWRRRRPPRPTRRPPRRRDEPCDGALRRAGRRGAGRRAAVARAWRASAGASEIVDRRRRSASRSRAPRRARRAGVDAGRRVAARRAASARSRPRSARGRVELAVEVGAEQLVELLGVRGGVGVVHGARAVGCSEGRRFPVPEARSASAARPRAIRDRTVPGGMPSTSAISA